MQPVLLGIIILIGVVVRFWGLQFGLPHTFARPDETTIIDVALSFLRGNLRPYFYDYPWFYMWLMTGLYLLYYAWGRLLGKFHSLADLIASWRVDWAPFFVLPRAMTAAIGAATIWPVYRIGRRLWDGTTALVAALFMALAFLHVRDSHYATTDVTMTFLLMVSVSFLIDGHLTKRRRDFVIGGIIGGLAAGTKYNALLMIVPLTASYLLNIFEEKEHRLKAARDPRFFIYGIPFLMAFAIGVPFLAFDLPRVAHKYTELRDALGLVGPRLAQANGWTYHLEFSLRYGLGLPLLVAALAGACAMIVFEPHAAIILLSFPIAYYVVAGNVKLLFFRYAIPLVPFLCLTAARFVTMAVGATSSVVIGRIGAPFLAANRLRNVGIGIAAIALVTPSACNVVQFDRVISRTDNRVVVARWFDDHVPPGSSVLLSGSYFGYVQFNPEMRYNAWVWDRRHHIFVTDLDKRPAVGHPEWILVQGSPLPGETQAIVRDFLQKDYAVAQVFPAFSPASTHVYDQQDMFFAPYAGFSGVERPGPNYTLYKRIGDP